MNEFIKQVIEEKFASKAQQRFFYAQAGKGGKKGKKWSKWAKEFSDDTDFEKIPEKVKKKKKEVDEIVDDKGNIARSKKPNNLVSKGITAKRDSESQISMAGGMQGSHPLGPFTSGRHGSGSSLRYWVEGKEYSKNELIEIALNKMLGADDTMLKPNGPENIKTAEKKMEDLVGGNEDEAEEKLEKMGYDEDLPKGQYRLVENPKKFIEEYLESILRDKSKSNDLVNKPKEMKEVNPIIKRQLTSLKETLKNNGLSYEDVLEYLKNNEQ